LLVSTNGATKMPRRKRTAGAPLSNENAMRKLGHIYTKNVSITLPEDLLKQTKECAEARGLKFSAMVVEALNQYLATIKTER